MKKKDGTVGELVSVLLIVLTIAILCFSFMAVIQIVNLDLEADQIARKYILEMETVGYLKDASKVQLQQELQNIGALNVDFTGTTLSNVGYGNPICLKISYSLPVEQLNTAGADMLAYFMDDVECPFLIYKMSTAKN